MRPNSQGIGDLQSMDDDAPNDPFNGGQTPGDDRWGYPVVGADGQRECRPSSMTFGDALSMAEMPTDDRVGGPKPGVVDPRDHTGGVEINHRSVPSTAFDDQRKGLKGFTESRNLTDLEAKGRMGLGDNP